MGSLLPLPSSAQQEELLDSIAAIVNEGVILESDVQTSIESVSTRFRQEGRELPPTAILRERMLDRLILKSIQLQRAENLGIKVPDSSVNRAVQSVARRNDMTLNQLRDALLADGLNYQQYREEVREELTLEQLRTREVETSIKVSDQELKEQMRREQGADADTLEHRVGHILISVPDGASSEELAAAQSKAEEAVASLQQGVNFAELALNISDGQNALDGGDLGWRKLEQLPRRFAEALRGLRAPAISEIVRSPGGFHILSISASRGESRSSVTELSARHILLIPTPLRDDEQTHNQLKDLRDRVLQGESFGALARAYSEDPGSAIKGGELAWFGPGMMTAGFENVVQSLQVGELSEPFRSRNGWHIVELLDRRVRDNTEEAMRNRAREIVFRRKLEAETELWLRRLLEEAYVEVRD